MYKTTRKQNNKIKRKPTKSHIDRQNYVTSYAAKMKECALCHNSRGEYSNAGYSKIWTEKSTGCRARYNWKAWKILLNLFTHTKEITHMRLNSHLATVRCCRFVIESQLENQTSSHWKVSTEILPRWKSTLYGLRNSCTRTERLISP